MDNNNVQQPKWWNDCYNQVMSEQNEWVQDQIISEWTLCGLALQGYSAAHEVIIEKYAEIY